jgi:transcriptional regulator with XRE-family HTH domain
MMEPTTTPKRTAEQRAEEEEIRRHHAVKPVRQRPAGAITQQSFTAILNLVARFKAMREAQGLTLADVAQRMGIDAPALSRLETGKMLNPTAATLHKWAEALGQSLDVGLSAVEVEPRKRRIAKRQHFSARFYLRNFAEPMFSRKLCVYEFSKKRWDLDRTPEGIGWSLHLCSVIDMEGNRTDEYDRFLKTFVEDPAIPPLRRLAMGGDLADADRSAIALFMALTLARLPEMMSGAMTEYLVQIPSPDRSELEELTKWWCKRAGKPYDSKSVAEFLKPGCLSAVWAWSKSLQRRLAHWEWHVLRTSRDRPFVTSDWPVFAQHDLNEGMGVVSFPVSSETALLLIFGGQLNASRDQAGEVRDVNLRTMCRASRFVAACKVTFPGDDALLKRATP